MRFGVLGFTNLVVLPSMSSDHLSGKCYHIGARKKVAQLHHQDPI